MVNTVFLKIPSHPKFLSVVRVVTMKVCSLYSFKEGLIEELKHAVDEACSNVIKYAYDSDHTKDIVIKYEFTKDRFIVVIEDKGKKSDLSMIRGRSLENVKPGGLGIHFIKKVFDIYKFDNRKRKGNRLVLIRNLESKDIREG